MNLGRFNDLIIFSEGLASLGTRPPRDVSLRKLRCDNCTLSDLVDCCWLLHHVVPMNGYYGYRVCKIKMDATSDTVDGFSVSVLR